MRAVVAVLLLMLPAAAHAKGLGGMSGETIGQIVVAIVTVVGGSGGLMYYRRHQQGAEGREDLSTRAKVAIARDNDEKALRERIASYRDEVAGLKERAESAELKAQAAVEASRELRAELRALRDRLDRQQGRADRQEDIAAMQRAVDGLAHQLGLALDDIARRAGDHRVR